MEPAIILPSKKSPRVSSIANPNMAEAVSTQVAESGRSPTQPEARTPTLIEKEQDNVSSSGKEKGAKNAEQGHEELLKLGTKKQAKLMASRAAGATLQRERYELSMRLEEEKFFAFMQGRPFVPGMQRRALASAKRINDLGTVTYPEGIQAPSKKLDGTILGKRYDREFMLQFKLFCRDKPQFSSNLDGLGVERPPPLAENDLSRSRHTQGSMGDSIHGVVDGSSGLNSGSPGGVAGQLPTGTRAQRGRQKKVSLDPNTILPPQQQQPVHEPALGGTKAAASLRACENPWTPWSVGRNKRTQSQNSLEFTERKFQALLNKLASKNFDTILGQVLGLANTSEDEKKGPVLDLIAKLVLGQASETPLFVEVFAQLSKEMTTKLPASVQDGDARDPDGEPIVRVDGQLFPKYLLDRCKEDMERSLSVVRAGLSDPSSQDDEVAGVRFEAQSNNGKPALFSDEYYAIYKAKRHCLNLTRFTGELFKAQMLSERIMHESVKQRLANINNPEEADIEMLCILLTKVGQELDTPKARGRVDGYYERMEKSVDSNKLSLRLRCLLLDVIELRKRNWGPRERIAQLHEQQPQGTSQEQPTSKQGRKPRRKKSPSRITSVNNESVHEATLGSTKAAASLRACENPWTPWSVGRNKRTQDQNSLGFMGRMVQALLNKLTSKNFDSILGQVFGPANTSEDEKKGPVLDLIAKLVLEHASETPLFVEVFARLSKEMTEKLPASVQDGNTRNPAGKPIVGGQLFRKYLLDRCKEDTERSLSVVRAGLSDPSSPDDKVAGVRFEAHGDNGKPALFSDEYYAICKAKRHCLNLTRFTGELFKAQMLSERIMHESIKKHLANINNPEEADIEMLCILLTKVGQELDTPKARGRVDGYFERMEQSVGSNKLSSRLKWLLLDVIDLRERNWGPRERIAQLHEQPQGASQKQPTSKQGRKPRRKKSPSRITSANNVPSASGHNSKRAT